jgi:hypothetical protein
MGFERIIQIVMGEKADFCWGGAGNVADIEITFKGTPPFALYVVQREHYLSYPR